MITRATISTVKSATPPPSKTRRRDSWSKMSSFTKLRVFTSTPHTPGRETPRLGDPNRATLLHKMWVFNSTGSNRVELHRFHYCATSVTCLVHRSYRGGHIGNMKIVACYRFRSMATDFYRYAFAGSFDLTRIRRGCVSFHEGEVGLSASLKGDQRRRETYSEEPVGEWSSFLETERRMRTAQPGCGEGKIIFKYRRNPP